jgi:hypothetical protein
MALFADPERAEQAALSMQRSLTEALTPPHKPSLI